MKLKFYAIAAIFSLASFLIALAFAARPETWLSDGSFVYYREGQKAYISRESLAVFADKKGCFHIFYNISKTETRTFSASQFVRKLAFIYGKHFYERIAVLSFPGADNSKIEEVLNNTSLFKNVEYGFSGSGRYARARALEFPQTELDFYYSRVLEKRAM